MPIGAPGWPELAFCTPSMASARMALERVEPETMAVDGEVVMAAAEWKVTEAFRPVSSLLSAKPAGSR